MQEQLPNGTNRNKTLDYLKGIAAVFVVLGHAITYLDNYPVTVPVWLRAIGTLASSVHVPLFFLISGFLCHRQPYGPYLKKKLIKILIPYITFAVLKLLFNTFISGDHAHGSSLLYNLYDTFILGGAYWFVYCILLIFLIAPIGWRKNGETLAHYNGKLLGIVGALIVFNIITVDFGYAVFPESIKIGGFELKTPFFQVERVLMYLPYFLSGMVLKENRETAVGFYKRFFVPILIVSVLMVAGVGFLVIGGVVDKGFFPKMLIAIGLMLLLYTLCSQLRSARFLETCGKYSLQIMFFDGFYRVVLFTVIAKLTEVRPVYALAVTAVVVPAAVLACLILRRIPFIRKMFGL